ALLRPADTIRALTEDTASDIWVAVTGRQLMRFAHGDRAIDESERIAAVGKNVRLLQASPDGSLWMAFDGAGIARLKDGVLRRVTTHEGLLKDNIEVMLPDGRGWWWFVAAEAIFKTSEAALMSVGEG